LVSKLAMDTYAASRPKKFGKKRALVVGASEVGRCMRQIGYLKKSEDTRFEVETDKDYVNSYGAITRGNVFETHWVKAMKHQYGDNFIMAGSKQRSWTVGVLSGTPDGIMINQKRDALKHLGVKNIKSDCFVIDCKTIDPRINLKEAKPEHVFQIQVQLGLLRELSEYKPVYGVLSYHNASFVDDIVEFLVLFAPSVDAEAKVRAAKIIHSESAAELLPEGWIAGGKECDYCRFQQACSGIRGNVPATETKKLDPQTLEHFIQLAMEYEGYDDTISGLEAKKRELQHNIKTQLQEHGLRKIDDGGIKIVWSPVVGRTSWDMPKLRAAAQAAGLDIQQFETVGDATNRLTVTVLPRSNK